MNADSASIFMTGAVLDAQMARMDFLETAGHGIVVTFVLWDYVFPFLLLTWVWLRIFSIAVMKKKY